MSDERKRAVHPGRRGSSRLQMMQSQFRQSVKRQQQHKLDEIAREQRRLNEEREELEAKKQRVVGAKFEPRHGNARLGPISGDAQRGPSNQNKQNSSSSTLTSASSRGRRHSHAPRSNSTAIEPSSHAQRRGSDHIKPAPPQREKSLSERPASKKFLQPNIRYSKKPHHVAPLDRHSAPLHKPKHADVLRAEASQAERSASAGMHKHPLLPEIASDNLKRDAGENPAPPSRNGSSLKEATTVTPQEVEQKLPATHVGHHVQPSITAAVSDVPSNGDEDLNQSAEDALALFEQQKQMRAKERQEEEDEKQRKKEAVKAKKEEQRKKKLEELNKRQEERQRRMKERTEARKKAAEEKRRQEAAQEQQVLANQYAQEAEALLAQESHDVDQEQQQEPKQEQVQKQARSASPPLPTHQPKKQPTKPTGAKPAAYHARRASQQPQQQEQDDKARAPPTSAPTPSGPVTMEVEEPMPDGTIQTITITLYPCQICNRKFKEDRIKQHESTCKANAAKKRKKFDMKAQRTAGMKAEDKMLLKDAKKNDKKYEKKAAAKKKNWRHKHEQFVSAIRAARGEGEALPSLPDPDLVTCEYCNRSFNEDAAARHIPICQKKSKNLAGRGRGRGGRGKRGRR